MLRDVNTNTPTPRRRRTGARLGLLAGLAGAATLAVGCLPIGLPGEARTAVPLPTGPQPRRTPPPLPAPTEAPAAPGGAVPHRAAASPPAPATPRADRGAGDARADSHPRPLGLHQPPDGAGAAGVGWAERADRERPHGALPGRAGAERRCLRQAE